METLWFLPSVIVIAFALAAVGLGVLEENVDTTGIPLVFPGDAEAARSILSSVAASVITVAGLTLSITMVVLQLVATQYTPRALRQVLGDRLTQVASGVFVGVFVFSLVALRSVRDENVPALGVTLSIVLSVAALGLLLGFVNNVAQSIQVETITAGTGRQAIRLIEQRYPDTAPASTAEDGDLPATTDVVRCDRTGFVRVVDEEGLARRAPVGRAVVELLVRPGDFVTRGDAVANVRAGPRVGLEEAIRASLPIADHRTLAQDEAFAIRLLADIALRALSPGINDPTTAINALRHAGAVLVEIARRPDRPSRSVLREGEIVLVQHPRPFDELLTPLEEVGRAAADVRPLAALLDVLERVVEAAAAGDQPSHAAAAAQAATRALAAARRTDPDPLLEALEETVTRTVLAARSAAAEAGIPRVSGHVSPTPERLSTS